MPWQPGNNTDYSWHQTHGNDHWSVGTTNNDFGGESGLDGSKPDNGDSEKYSRICVQEYIIDSIWKKNIKFTL